MKTAILFGATGHVGAYLLPLLLNDPNYTKVLIVVRRPVALDHPKLTVLIADIEFLSQVQHKLIADEVFITVGIGDPALERKYIVQAANLCRWNDARSIFIVTAVGASPTSRLKYVRTKGEIEQDILSMHYPHTHLFRPGLIQGKRKHYRSMEKTMMTIWKILDPLFIGPLKKYKGMHARDIAMAMYQAAQGFAATTAVYHQPDMKILAGASTTQSSPAV